jgi:isopentenyldiphosphate isomerase
MTDWNPNDPDATRVHYDLTVWDFDQQAELAAAMADAEIPHAWDGNELIVPEEMEQTADDLIARIEAELGIVSDPRDQVDQVTPAGERPAAIDLADDEPTTEYDLADWSAAEIDTVSIALADARIPFRWEEQLLLVSSTDEDVVEALLDDIESGEYVDVGGAHVPTAEDELSAEVLTTFFLAAERLQRDPLDADGLDHLRRATEVADPEVAPFGVTARLWRLTCELAEDIVDALVDDEEPDHDAAMASAAKLHELLRSHV